MANVAHKNLTDPDIHEPKGVSTALLDQVYVADGLSSGSWQTLPTVDPADIQAPVGIVVDFAGTTAPPGWMLCYGQEISRSTYSTLFAITSTTYGAGNGTTTFNVPDHRGRITASVDDGVGRLTGATLGAMLGTQTHLLTTGQTPVLSGTTSIAGAHTHTLNNGTLVTRSTTSGTAFAGTAEGAVAANLALESAGDHTHSMTVNSTSTNQPHSNVQPSLVFNKIIYHGVI